MPELDTVATCVSELVQKPPDAGDRAVVLPSQMLVSPKICTIGFAWTVTGAVAFVKHPEEFSLKVKVAVPAEIPTITPELFT